MENIPKVSVIIPVYNTQKYISECIESCLSQTLKDIEIICVDDGSEDASIIAIQKEQKSDSRIKIAHIEHGGPSKARNAGIKIATGKYLYFLDSDDYIAKNLLEVCYNVAEEEKADIVTFDAETVLDSEYLVGQSDSINQKYERFKDYYKRKCIYSDCVKGQDLFVKMKQRGEYRCAVWLQFIKRSYLRKANLFFYEGIIHEDHLFTLKSFLLAEKIVYLQNIFYYRRIRANSIMTSVEDIDNLNGYLITYTEVLRFLTIYINKFDMATKRMVVYEMNNQYARSVAKLARKLPTEKINEYYNALSFKNKMIFNKIIYDDNVISK